VYVHVRVCGYTCSELDLGGLSKPGHPGLVIIEGEVRSVDLFIQRIRSDHIKWKTMEMACEEQMEGRKGESLEELRRFKLPFTEIIHYAEPELDDDDATGGAAAEAEPVPLEKVRMLERQMTADAAALCDTAGQSGLYRRAMGIEPRHVRQQPPKLNGPDGRRVREGVSRRLRMRLSIAEERVKADGRESTQHTMLRQETDRYESWHG
jgi:hypothetical protein